MFIVVQKAKNPSNGGHLSLSPSVRFENMKYVNVNAITLPPMVPTKQPNSVKYTTNVCFVFRVAWFENQILFFFFVFQINYRQFRIGTIITKFLLMGHLPVLKCLIRAVSLNMRPPSWMCSCSFTLTTS